MRADREIDFHGHTREEMRLELDRLWGCGAWAGPEQVRVIHGRGAALWRELHAWCREHGLAFERERHGGSTIISVAAPERSRRSDPPHRPLERLGELLRDRPLAPQREPCARPREDVPCAQPPAEPPAADHGAARAPARTAAEDDRAAFERAVRDVERQDPRVLHRRKGAR